MITILGGGIGGLAAAIALRRAGREVRVIEQASRFARVGADINLTPNAVRALDGLGVGDAVRQTAAQPRFRISRMWDTGAETSRLPMAEEAERAYGAPQLTLHRADLLEAMRSALPDGVLQLGRRAQAVTVQGAVAAIAFADGREEPCAALIGADGIHSLVRTALHGPEPPRFTGVVAFRAVVPAARLCSLPNLDSFTKWWGPSPTSQIVTFPLNRGEDIFIFATIAQESWRHEGWTQPGSVDELRDLYADFHPEARALLDACDAVLKTALYERDPLPFWSRGAVTLLGDAAHPMMPFMAQGAGQAIEDAVVLARCVAAAPDLPTAFRRYQAARLDRTARIQIGSRENAWLREGGNADWVYGYDSWAIPLAEAA
ncbi:FAD-dependent monooxygenase [Leptolyngbya sp. 15MV]|nr:FAD-dependent monooxygenase [Leptolyngbya sp. 15MV]